MAEEKYKPETILCNSEGYDIEILSKDEIVFYRDFLGIIGFSLKNELDEKGFKLKPNPKIPKPEDLPDKWGAKVKCWDGEGQQVADVCILIDVIKDARPYVVVNGSKNFKRFEHAEYID